MKTLRLLRLLLQLLALAGGVLIGETAVGLLARGCAGPTRPVLAAGR